MTTVELVYHRDCPNVAVARAHLLRAFARSGLPPTWSEWPADAAEVPGHVRGYGSPTILVDGCDVAGANQNGGASCRLYSQPSGALQGVPSVETIARVLTSTGHANGGGSGTGQGWTLTLAMMPGLGAAFLPKVTCPACWPAYAGFLSSVGLGFLLDTAYLLPLTIVSLSIALGALAYRARRRRGYLPVTLGLGAGTAVVIGKFTFESDPVLYAGLATLIVASLWNAWPRRQPAATCPTCIDAQQPHNP